MRRFLPLAALLALLLPAPSLAATFCVGADPGCRGIAKGNDLAGAFDDAARLPGPDRIQIATGTFKLPPGGVSYAASDAVEVVGAGRGRTTILANSGTTLSLGGTGAASSSVRDLTINAPNEGYAIQTAGLVQRVEVIRIEGLPTAGVALEGAGRFLDGSVRVGGAWSIVTFGLENRIADSELSSGGGVVAFGGRALVERVAIPRADDHQGLGALGGTLVARDVLVVVVGKQSALAAVTTPGSDGVIDASQVTLVNKGSAEAAVSVSATHQGRTARIGVRNAIIAGFRRRGTGTSENGGNAYATFDFSREGDPGFVDPANGDYRLKAGSPAIDAGEPGGLEPGESPTDLDGKPRIAGGRRDLGAYEYQPPDRTPPQVGIAPGSVRLLAGNVIRLRLTCPSTESECSGVLRVRSKRDGTLLGSARFELIGGRARTVVVRLSAASAAAIRRAKAVRAIAVVDARDRAGNRGTSKRTLIIRSPRRT
jgi:hypothetical protein